MGASDTVSVRASRAIKRLLIGVLPENCTGDRIHSFLHFVYCNHRVPSGRLVFNDALYRLKTSNDMVDPLRVFVSDKEFVKLYVKATVGDQYNVPTVGVIRDRAAVDNYDFPADCCIKPTHLSGQVILRRGSGPIDLDRVRGWFGLSQYRKTREVNYRTLRPKVIVEPLIFGTTNVDDYKFFCVHGSPRLIQVDIDRHSDHCRQFYSPDWALLPFSVIYPRSDRRTERPENLKEMLFIASTLASAFSLVRVDLYSDGGQILVGELTNCHENAGGYFIPRRAEREASELLFGRG